MKKIIAVFFMIMFVFGSTRLKQIEMNRMEEENLNSYFVNNYTVQQEAKHTKGLFIDIVV